MLYRLLRNNKESGPYTALQLQEMGLKPYDLLWTEGRGAAWQYASEIPELKSFAPVIEEQPFERFFKKEEAKNNAKETTVATKKTKPRFRISGDKIIMVEAGNMEVATNGSIKQTATGFLSKEPVAEKVAESNPDWKNIYEEWQPQPQKKAAKKDEPVEVETKYSESLDDLKKRYAEKVLNEKKEKPSPLNSSSVKQNIMAAVALLVLAVGGYVGYSLKQKDASKKEGAPVVERADVAGGNTLSSQPNNDNTAANNSAENSQQNTTANNNIDNNAAQIKTAKPVAPKSIAATSANNAGENKIAAGNLLRKETSTTAKTNVPANKTTDKTIALNQKKTDAAKTNNIVNNAKPVVPANTTNAAKNNTGAMVMPPVATPPAAKQNAPKKIDDYVSVKRVGGSGNSVQNVRLLVNNVTDFPIDLAVIDIQYFDGKGKYQKGETMYVKNINGGNNVEVRVPDSDKSSSIKYKVSLVQSEQKTLYLVGD